ncbi:MAG TPA: hypothetical protein VHD56_06060 [Tepidisphaeraceae bacterium]|nr:hypothetical protein [Tepidisphaeraceae bacterium]
MSNREFTLTNRPMPRDRSRHRLLLALMAVMFFAGCAAPAASTSVEKPAVPQPVAPTVAQNSSANPSVSACAAQLHELCGPLMLYFNMHAQLPEKLADLRQLPGFENLDTFSCPVSKQLYVYTPQGVKAPEEGWFIIVADSAPVHAGVRFAIAIREPQPGSPLVTNVIVLDPNAPPPKPIIIK